MTPSEYQRLTDFFVDQLERQTRELRSLIGVSEESLRYEIRLVADGVLTNTRRIEEHSQRLDRLTVRVGALESTVSGLFADHEARLRSLEGGASAN